MANVPTHEKQYLIAHKFRSVCSIIFSYCMRDNACQTLRSGLEKLTNANRSVCSVSDRLFPVELTKIADWKSICPNICYIRISEKP